MVNDGKILGIVKGILCVLTALLFIEINKT